MGSDSKREDSHEMSKKVMLHSREEIRAYAYTRSGHDKSEREKSEQEKAHRNVFEYAGGVTSVHEICAMCSDMLSLPSLSHSKRAVYAWYVERIERRVSHVVRCEDCSTDSEVGYSRYYKAFLCETCAMHRGE